MDELEKIFVEHCARLNIHGMIMCYAGATIAEDTWQIYFTFPDRKYQVEMDNSMGIHSGATLTEAMSSAVALLEIKN